MPTWIWPCTCSTVARSSQSAVSSSVVTRRMDIRFFETLGFRAVPESEAPAWLLERRDILQKILPESSLVFGVRDASVVSF